MAVYLKLMKVCVTSILSIGESNLLLQGCEICNGNENFRPCRDVCRTQARLNSTGVVIVFPVILYVTLQTCQSSSQARWKQHLEPTTGSFWANDVGCGNIFRWSILSGDIQTPSVTEVILVFEGLKTRAHFAHKLLKLVTSLDGEPWAINV